MTFQEIILTLQEFWSKQGCILAQPYDVEKGAGTMNPSTFLRVLGPEPWHVAYVEPSRRPADGRYGENPNRLFQHHQFQVIMKPSPDNIQELYLQSLAKLGINEKEHDIRFVEDNWESPTLGAWGLGWEVWLDGMEITQFTYFQQVGSVDVKPVASEITYGLERIAMYIQEKENVYDIDWNGTYTYGDVFHQNEFEQSTYNFELADTALLFQEHKHKARYWCRSLRPPAAAAAACPWLRLLFPGTRPKQAWPVFQRRQPENIFQPFRSWRTSKKESNPEISKTSRTSPERRHSTMRLSLADATLARISRLRSPALLIYSTWSQSSTSSLPLCKYGSTCFSKLPAVVVSMRPLTSRMIRPCSSILLISIISLQ